MLALLFIKIQHMLLGIKSHFQLFFIIAAARTYNNRSLNARNSLNFTTVGEVLFLLALKILSGTAVVAAVTATLTKESQHETKIQTHDKRKAICIQHLFTYSKKYTQKV